jgi:phage-related holin
MPQRFTTLAERYFYPLTALLVDDIWWKATIAVVLASIERLFSLNIELCVLVAALVMIDFCTGILAARKAGVPMQSRHMRQTVVKSLEYWLFLAMITGLAHGFDKIPFFDHIEEMGYFLVCVTEGKSITENVWGKRKGAIIWSMITRRGNVNSTPSTNGVAPVEAASAAKDDQYNK